jgi:hypothetical protein
MKILQWMKTNHIFWFLFLSILFVVTRGLALDRFVTTDETPWLMRGGNFYYALGQREFSKTRQTPDPAVTTMIVNATAFLIDYPQYRGFGEGYFKEYINFDSFVQSKNINAHTILITARELMLLEDLILFLLAFGIAIRLVNIIPAVAGFLLIALSPYHIALTMVSHTDGQLSCLMLVAVLSFLAYFLDKQRMIYVIFSAIATSLGCLTKLPAYVLFPFFGSIMIFAIVRNWRNGFFKNKDQAKIWWKRTLLHPVIWIGVFLTVYFLLWPAMWVDPIGTLIKQIRAPFMFVESGNDSTVTAAISTASSSGILSLFNTFQKDAVFYFHTYLWQTTPIELIGVAVALVLFFLKVTFFKSPINHRIAGAFFWFIFLYVFFISLSSKLQPRYIIPAFVFMDVIAALGWLALIQLILSIQFKGIKYALFSLMMVGLFAIQIGGDVSVYPYFYSYYNPLMGGAKIAGETKFVGSGEGLDQAGQYLSQKPGAKDLTAMSWYGSGCFSYYFSGTTIVIPTGLKDNKYMAENLAHSDYLVIYTNQWHRRIPASLFDILDHVVPEHTIWINDIEYVRIYRVKDLPPEVLNPLL